MSTDSVETTYTNCLWATNWPDLREGCLYSQVCRTKPPFKCQFTKIDSIFQNTPICGLTALSLISHIPTRVLIEKAQALQYSITGEIYSVCYLNQLIIDIKENSKTLSANFTSFIFKGNLNCTTIKRYLVEEAACLLVAYDRDADYSPCLSQGHRAHWALIIGYLIPDESSEDFYVLARHGNNNRIAVWPLDLLADSNSNLADTTKPDCIPVFYLPPGGVTGNYGLRERSIVIHGMNREVITIR